MGRLAPEMESTASWLPGAAVMPGTTTTSRSQSIARRTSSPNAAAQLPPVPVTWT
jgi:hypothetical protein